MGQEWILGPVLIVKEIIVEILIYYIKKNSVCWVLIKKFKGI